jgi:protein required for attachment to host cells
MVYGELSLVARDKRDKIGNFLLPNARCYVIAGDSAEARVFLTERRFGVWSEVATLTNPEATKREQDLLTDKPGRVFDSFGKGRHAMTPEESSRQHQKHRFAHDVVTFLSKGITAGDFSHLVLIVEPTFLGHLRQELSPALKKSIVYELPMNPSAYDVEKLKSLLT